MNAAIFTVAWKVISSMAASLMTERFLKWAVIKGLEVVVKKTKTTVDDELLARCREEWERGAEAGEDSK